MAQRTFTLGFALLLCFTPPIFAADLSTATSAELLQIYSQLRMMKGGDQGAVTENVVLKRDAATFTFRSGHLRFAAPAGGRMVAAIFAGDASFQLDPPTPMDHHQLSRFTNEPKLSDTFHNAVFFFTDDTWSQLQKTLEIQGGFDPVETASYINRVQEKQEKNFNAWWANERAGNFTMRNLPARILADLTDPSSRGFFLADFKGERIGNLLFQISWNRPSILLPALASGDEVMLIHYDLGKYSEFWSGFHLAPEYASNPHPDHSLQYLHCPQETIEADITKDNRLSAAASMPFEIQSGTPRALPLSLEAVLRIDSITDDKGNKLSFIQEPRELDSDPWVILPAPANPGGANTLKISYHEDSTSETRILLQRGGTLHSVYVGESWYPHFGAFDDRTIFDLRLHCLNNQYKFAATGGLVESKHQGENPITEWRSPTPFSTAGFNYGDLTQGTAKSPSLAVTAYVEKLIPGEFFYDKAREEAAKSGAANIVPLGLQGDLLSWESRSGQQRTIANAEAAAAHVDTSSLLQQATTLSERAADFFGFYYGPLPFGTVSLTAFRMRGDAQSWPMLILPPFQSVIDAKMIRTLGWELASEDRDFHDLPAVREHARQWWGGEVGPKTYHDRWLFEGLPEFSAALYLGQFRPAAWNSFWDMEKNSLLTEGNDGRRPVDAGPVWLNQQTGRHGDLAAPGILVHQKGAFILQMLRTLMSDPKAKNPDEGFIAMMQDFAKTYAGQNASTADFQKIAETHMRRPMDWFFNEWVYGTEVPQYDLSYQFSDAAGGKTLLTMSLKQSGVSDSFVMEVPVFVELKQKMFQLGLIRMQGSTAQNGQIPLPFRPDRVVLDANHSILCTISQ